MVKFPDLESTLHGPYVDEHTYSDHDNSRASPSGEEEHSAPNYLRSEVVGLSAKKNRSSSRRVLKGATRTMKEGGITRKFNNLFSKVDELLIQVVQNRVNVVTVKEGHMEPTLSRNGLRNKLNRIEREREKSPLRKRRRRWGMEPLREKSTLSYHRSRGQGSHSLPRREEESTRREKSIIRHERGGSQSGSTRHSATSHSERDELNELKREKEAKEEADKAMLARIKTQQAKEKEVIQREGRLARAKKEQEMHEARGR